MPSGATDGNHPRKHDRQETADRRPDGLPQRETRTDLAARRRHKTGGAVDGREAEDDEHRRNDGEEPRLPLFHPATRRRNVAPRSS